VHNGLLWDAAFDPDLVTFDEDGRPEFSPALSQAAHPELRWQANSPYRQAQGTARSAKGALHWSYTRRADA